MWNSMLCGFGAGVVGGTLGLGGAIILVPVWLSSGIDKTVATSSSGPLIFFSALISFMMSFLQKTYDNYLMLIFYFVLAFFGAWVIKSIESINNSCDKDADRKVSIENNDFHFAADHNDFFFGGIAAIPDLQLFPESLVIYGVWPFLLIFIYCGIPIISYDTVIDCYYLVTNVIKSRQ